MNVEATSHEVLSRLEGFLGMAVVWTVAPAVLLAMLILALIYQLRANARMDRAIDSLSAEIERLRAGQKAAPAPQRPRPRPNRPPQSQGPTPSGEDLVPMLNELLASQQPYNFVESIRAVDSRLILERLTPCMNDEPFAQEPLLESGGDGLFAHIDGDIALLFPNYSRFSATLDPKPLFDGAAHGGRIHSLLRPAVLSSTGGGRWRLIEKGRVHMRQGGETIR